MGEHCVSSKSRGNYFCALKRGVLYSGATDLGPRLTEVSLIQGCPFRGVPGVHDTIIFFIVATLITDVLLELDIAWDLQGPDDDNPLFP